MSPAKTAEPIEMLFGLWAQIDPRNHVLGSGAHLRRLLNIIEQSMCGGDAADCKIALTAC